MGFGYLSQKLNTRLRGSYTFPGANGREISRDLSKNAATAHLCILAFSSTPKTSMDYTGFKADDYVEKPFEIKVFLKVLAYLKRAFIV